MTKKQGVHPTLKEWIKDVKTVQGRLYVCSKPELGRILDNELDQVRVNGFFPLLKGKIFIVSTTFQIAAAHICSARENSS